MIFFSVFGAFLDCSKFLDFSGWKLEVIVRYCFPHEVSPVWDGSRFKVFISFGLYLASYLCVIYISSTIWQVSTGRKHLGKCLSAVVALLLSIMMEKHLEWPHQAAQFNLITKTSRTFRSLRVLVWRGMTVLYLAHRNEQWAKVNEWRGLQATICN